MLGTYSRSRTLASTASRLSSERPRGMSRPASRAWYGAKAKGRADPVSTVELLGSVLLGQDEEVGCDLGDRIWLDLRRHDPKAGGGEHLEILITVEVTPEHGGSEIRSVGGF